MLPLIVLSFVFLAIAIRKIGRVHLKVWQIMGIGALAVIITGSITLIDAIKSINLEVMLFLFGMFVVGQAFEDSGYLSYISYKYFSRARNLDVLLLMVIFGSGISAALLMNDTLAIVGTPVVLHLATRHRFNAKILLLALAFSITIGSVMSPIGNPQNLLIATAMPNPFLEFIINLAFPTIINLALLYLLLRIYYGKEFHKARLTHDDVILENPRLAMLARISLATVILLISAKIILFFEGFDFSLVYIALAGALPILVYRVFSTDFHIVRKIDWHTLIFFASMFIVMESVWDTGFFQSAMEGLDITSVPTILVISTLLSQLISNVPLVALYLPMIGSDTTSLIALAAGSTIAGNLTILGAASNIIIFHKAEKRGVSITFWDFFRIGAVLTALNLAVYYLFLI